MLTAIAAFAEAFVNPLAPALMLGAALLVPARWQVRVAAVGLGGLLALPARLGVGYGELSLAMLGAMLALLLHAEIALHLVLPFLRWIRNCAVAAWELAWLVLTMLRRLWHRPALGRSPPPGKDRWR